MKKLLLLTILLVETVLYSRAQTNSPKQDTSHKTASDKDTLKIKSHPMFNADVYIYGTIDPILAPAGDIKSHPEKYADTHILAIGKVFSGALGKEDGIITLCIGGNYPNQDLLVIIKKRNHAKFGHPETDLIGHQIGVAGFLSHYKGMLAIKLSRQTDLQIH